MAYTQVDDANPIQDAYGNKAADLTATTVTNNSGETTLPVFAGATVNGSTLVMTYTEGDTLSITAPATTDFTVTDGSTQITVSSVVVDATNKTVTLTLASAVQPGDAVTVAYNQVGDANPIQDANGNKAVSFESRSVTNNTPAPTPVNNTPTPPTQDVITADPAQQTDTAAYINSQINNGASTVTVAPPVASLDDYQTVVAAADNAASTSGKTINVVLPSAQVVALPQNTLEDSANAGYTSALQKANDVVIATATSADVNSFNSTVNTISGYAAGSKVVLPQLASVAVTPTDLNNSAFVAALQDSGDTTLTLDLSNSASNGGGSAANAGTYSVLPGFTQVFSGGAKGNNYMVGATSNLGIANPTVTTGATASTSQTLTVQSLTAAAAEPTPSTGPSSGFQQIYTAQIQGYSADYTLSSSYGTATLTSKSSGQVITVNIPQPLAGANNSGIDLQFLDGSLSITGNTNAVSGLWTAWVTQGVASGGNLGGWYNNSATPLVPAANSAQALDLGSAAVQNNLLNSADNSQRAGFNGGASLGLLPSSVTTLTDSTPNAILTGILGAGANNPATFLSGDNITLTGGNTTLNLFDFSGGAALPANTTVSGVNTLNLASNARIGSATSADNFSSWYGLTTINATASGAGANANDNGLINVLAGNGTAVNLTANDAYVTTNGSNSQVGAITVGGGSKITITQKLGTADGSPISSGGITVNGGSATTSVTVTQTAAVSGKVTDGAVTINDLSANSTTLAGSLTTVVLNNYGGGSVINDNALRFLTLSGTSSTLTLNDSNTSNTNNTSGSVPISTLYLTLTGLSAAGDNTLTDLNNEITTLNIITAGTVNSTLNGFVDSHLTALSVQGTSALTLLNPAASLTSYSVSGSAASLTVASHSGAAEAKLSLKGAVTYTAGADAVSSGITLTAGSDHSNISFTTTGALSGGNSNTFTLGNGNNTLSDIVTAQSGSVNSTTTIAVGTGSNQISTGGNTVNIALGKHAAGVIDSVSVGASVNGSLSILTAISGAQAGDKIIIADATQFNNTAITAANVTAAGGDATTLTGWINAALSAQGANLQSHAVGWFSLGGNTYLIEQANSQGSAFAAGDTLVKLVGTLNESAAALNGHTVTL